MMRILYLSENNEFDPLMFNLFLSAFTSQLYYNPLNLEILLERLEKQDRKIFNRIVRTIKTDYNPCTLLATELVRLRLLERNLRLALKLIHNYNSIQMF